MLGILIFTILAKKHKAEHPSKADGGEYKPVYEGADGDPEKPAEPAGPAGAEETEADENETENEPEGAKDDGGEDH